MTRDIGALRIAAVALAVHACGGEKGRSKDDPVYAEVTEWRDVGAMRARYSSCGDLAHWMLYRLGCRAPWVNRKDMPMGWRVGQNVSLLTSHGELPGGDDWDPEPGDILVIWNSPNGYDAHVCVWLGGGEIANYGAGGMSAAARPGSNITRPSFTWSGHSWYIGKRRVQRVVSLAHLPFSEPPDLTGAELTGEVIDALTEPL